MELELKLKLQILIENIEKLRNLLYSLASNKRLTDQSVVDCSQQLDKLLIEYEKCRKKLTSGDAA